MSFWYADVNLIALDKASIFIKCLKFLFYLLLVILFKVIYGNVPLDLLINSALFSSIIQICKVTPVEVSDIIANMDENKSSDSYIVPTKLIKLVRLTLSEPFSTIANSSFLE